jgi:hypothetical protein
MIELDPDVASVWHTIFSDEAEWLARQILSFDLTCEHVKLLPATSNAVERGNRRHRKRQKSVYRVRSQSCLEGRIALDMLRESRAHGRDHTTQALHQARRGYT